MCKRDEDISIPSDSSKPSCFFPLPNFNSPGNFNAPRNFLSFRGERKVRGGIQVKSINYTTRRNLHDDVTTGIIVPRWGNKSRVAKTNIRYARSDQNRDILLSDKRNTPFRVSSRAVFRCRVSIFRCVYRPSKTLGKCICFTLDATRLDCYSRCYNVVWSLLSLFSSNFFLSFFFFFFLFNFPPSPNEH